MKETYEAILAVGEIADRLKIPAGSPLMLENRLAMDEQGVLLLGASVYMRTDIQKMEMSRKRTMTPKRHSTLKFSYQIFHHRIVTIVPDDVG